MSVENKIREFLKAETISEAYPGAGKNKEASAPSQGSSEKPPVKVLDKGAGVDAAKKAGSATTLAAGSAGMDKTNPTQGSSNANPEKEDLGADEPGKVASSKAKKTSLPAGRGAGKAPNFTAMVDPSTVVGQSSSKGNVHQEEIEVDAEDVLTEEEFEALSDEEKANYEMVELSEEEGEELISAEEFEALSDEEKEEYEMISGTDDEVVQEQTYDFSSDIKSLFEGDETLSEEFKTKAASIFEAVVLARVANIRAELEENASLAAAEVIQEQVAEITEKVDSYLNYVVEKWMENNEVAVESGLRSEMTQQFINGLRTLFAENFIEVPEERYDVIGEMQASIEKLEAALNEKLEESAELSAELSSLKRSTVLSDVTEGLAQTEIEKFKTLVEDISFENEATFAEKMKVVKENYFPKAQTVSNLLETDDASPIEVESDSSVMKYAAAIANTKFTK